MMSFAVLRTRPWSKPSVKLVKITTVACDEELKKTTWKGNYYTARENHFDLFQEHGIRVYEYVTDSNNTDAFMWCLNGIPVYHL